MEAVDEVGNPTILATFTVIAAILPMAMVRGLMGPYMRPIPIGASAAMIFSLLVAFVITPWAAQRFMRGAHAGHAEGEAEDRTTRLYRWFMGKLLSQRQKSVDVSRTRIVLLLLAACSMVYFKLVIVKMLPFDNKSEFQVIVDMPEGTSLEQTAAATRALAAQTEPGSGNHGFRNLRGNGLAVQLQRACPPLLHAPRRECGGHPGQPDSERRPLGPEPCHRAPRPGSAAAVAAQYGIRMKVAEVPPGPPVLQTLVAEVYGPDYDRQIELAGQLRDMLEKTPGVVDVDWYVEDPQPEMLFHFDRLKASLAGVSIAEAQQAVALGISGSQAGLLHLHRKRKMFRSSCVFLLPTAPASKP